MAHACSREGRRFQQIRAWRRFVISRSRVRVTSPAPIESTTYTERLDAFSLASYHIATSAGGHSRRVSYSHQKIPLDVRAQLLKVPLLGVPFQALLDDIEDVGQQPALLL